MGRTERHMSEERNPDFWQMMFEQTPVVIRYILGILTLGLFTLASVLYKWHRDDMERMHERMDDLDDKMDRGFSEIRGYLMANQRFNNRQD
jgi:hypothetical protein